MATAPTGILYAATVLLWGCSFIAIANLQGAVALEMSIVYRDALCAILALGYALLRGQSLRFSRRDHLFLAVQGAFLFALNDLFVFNAVGYLTSGLVALVISLVMVMNVIFGALFLGFAIRPRVVLAAGLGIGGVALVFWPDLVAFDPSSEALTGLGLALCSPIVFSLGQIIVARNQLSDLPLMRSTGVAMGYGALAAFAMAMLLGRDVTWSFAPAFLASFFYITLIGTLLGFFMYFTILGRIGPGRAAYISVLTPMIALIVSTLFEGFVWTETSLAGAAIILAGNALVVTGGPAATVAPSRTKPS